MLSVKSEPETVKVCSGEFDPTHEVKADKEETEEVKVAEFPIVTVTSSVDGVQVPLETVHLKT